MIIRYTMSVCESDVYNDYYTNVHSVSCSEVRIGKVVKLTNNKDSRSYADINTKNMR